jgi:purine nucleosidase
VHPILLDTDPGVDDALALLLALRSPEMELVAVTTVAGNVGLAATTRNALLLLDLAGRPDVPVHAGADVVGAASLHTFPTAAPVTSEAVSAADVHGGDGLGGITSLRDAGGQCRYPPPQRTAHPTSAIDAIPGYARARPGEITLVAVGPLTNVAAAARRDLDGVRCLREIVVMGGAFRTPGNITPVAEFNIFADPEAVEAVLSLGLDIRFVPLDVTEQVLIVPGDLNSPADDRQPNSTRDAGPLPHRLPHLFYADLLRHTFDFYTERIGYPGCHLHDPLAIAAVIRPDLFRFRDAFVQIERTGEITRGMTVADLRQRRLTPLPNCAFAEDVDADAARRFVLERLLGHESTAS